MCTPGDQRGFLLAHVLISLHINLKSFYEIFVFLVFSGYLFDLVFREGILLGVSVLLNGVCNCIIPYSKSVNIFYSHLNRNESRRIVDI